MEKLYFKLVDGYGQKISRKALGQLIKSIPLNWEGVSARLKAPNELLGVTRQSGFIFDRSGFKLQGITEQDETYPPDYNTLFIKKEWPGSVSIDDAGVFSCITLDEIRPLIIGYAELGYKGWITFRTKNRNNDANANGAWCEIRPDSWTGAPMLDEESGKQPARIQLGWDQTHGGEAADVMRILETCQLFKLEQYVPSAGVPA